MPTRTWQVVMDEMATHGILTTQDRCARGFRSKAYGAIRNKPLDWHNGILIYRRKKLGLFSEPARLTIGRKLKTLLQSLPCSGDLFPNIKTTSANHRSAEFRRSCRVAAVTGVSLHSYRHAWAQRAKACGYPQRFAQEALGHNSRAVHEAYAKGALVILPALDEYEQGQITKVIRLRSVS